MRYVEVERKFALVDHDQLIDRLKELGATAAVPARQIDTYYNAPHRDFLAPASVSEWLRLREEDGRTSVNYKRWLPEGAMVKTHCDEYESALSDAEAVRRTLLALNFVPLVVVDKVRQEWHLADDSVIVAVDEVAGLGSFVELEFCGNASTVAEARDRLAKFVARLCISLGEPLNRGYPHLLLGREK